MKNFDPIEFQKVFTRAEAFYKSLVKIYCPALGQDVHFTSDGFHHLQFDGTRSERNKSTQRSKMLCLEEAVGIIRKTTTIQEFRQSMQAAGKADRSGFRQTKKVEYYALIAVTNANKHRRINVVIRKVGEGNYHFWSVSPAWKEQKIDGQQTVRRIDGGWMMDA